MNRVSIFCPNCLRYSQLQKERYSQLQEAGQAPLTTFSYHTLCCYRILHNNKGEAVKNQEGLIKVLQGGSWRVGGKSFTAKDHP
jgi:hypothetical protein